MLHLALSRITVASLSLSVSILDESGQQTLIQSIPMQKSYFYVQGVQATVKPRNPILLKTDTFFKPI